MALLRIICWAFIFLTKVVRPETSRSFSPHILRSWCAHAVKILWKFKTIKQKKPVLTYRFHRSGISIQITDFAYASTLSSKHISLGKFQVRTLYYFTSFTHFCDCAAKQLVSLLKCNKKVYIFTLVYGQNRGFSTFPILSKLWTSSSHQTW